jgi:hypothetical protein
LCNVITGYGVSNLKKKREIPWFKVGERINSRVYGGGWC